MNSPDRLLVFDRDFLEDLHFWFSTNRRTAIKVLELVEAIRRDPFDGLGKPEPLRHLLPIKYFPVLLVLFSANSI